MAAVIGSLRAELSASIAQFQRDMGKAADTIRGMSKEFTKVSKDFQSTGRQMQSVGTALTKTLTLPLVAFGAAAIKIGIDFESSFAGVRKTVEASEAEFAQMATGLRNLAKTIPVNVNELNRLAEAAGALGIPKEEIVDFARVMAQLGTATNVTSDQAAESIAKIQNIFGAAGKDTERFASTLVALGNAGASTESQILEMATRVASAGNIIGLTQSQVLGISSAIADVGIEAEAGGSAISQVMTKMAKAVSGGGEALAAFAKVADRSSEEFAEKFRTNAAEAIALFVEGLGRVKKGGGDLIKTLDELGIEEIRQANLLRSLAGSSENFRASLDRSSKAWRENSALTKEVQERYKTTASQLRLLEGRIRDIGVTIFASMKPAIDSAITAANKLTPLIDQTAKAFGALPGSVQLSIIALAGIAAALGPIVFVSGQVISSLGTMIGAFGKAGLATKALTGTLAGLEAAMIAIRNINIGSGLLSVLVGAGGAAAAGVGIAAALAAVGVAADKFKQKLDDQAAAAKRLGTPIAGARQGLISLSDAQAQAAKSGQDLRDGMEVTIKAFEKAAGGAGGGAKGAAATFAQQLAAANKEIARLSPAMRNDLAKAIESGVFEMEELQKQSGLSERALKLFKDQIEAWSKSQEDATKKLKAWNEAVAQRRVPQLASQGGLNPIPNLPTKPITDLNQLVRDFSFELTAAQIETTEFGQVLQNQLVPNLGKVTIELDDAKEKAVGFGTALKSIFTGKGFGDFGKFLKGGLGSVVTGFFEGIGSSIFNALNQLINKGLAAILNGLKRVFGIGGEGRKIVRDFAQSFSPYGDDFTAGFDALHKKLAELGAEGERLWIKLTQGVGRNNPKEAKRVVQDITEALEEQKKKVEETKRKYEEFYDKLKGSVDDTKTKLSSITQITPAIKAALDNVFNQKTPQGYLEAVQKLNTELDKQAKRYDTIKSTLEKYNLPFTAAGKEFKQETINVRAKEIVDDFIVLRDAGVEINTQIRGMGDKIREFIKDAQKAGVEVPNSMKSIIQHAIDAGEVFDKDGKKITDMSQLGLTFGQTMETVMTQTIPSAIAKLTLVLEGIAKFLGIKLPEAAQTGADKVQTELDGIEPPDLTIDVDFDIAKFKLPKNIPREFDIEGFQHGSDGIRDFGSGTLAMLHGREAVVTEGQLKQAASASQMDSMGAVTIENHFHGAVLAEKSYVAQHVTEPVLESIERYFLRKFARLQTLAAEA